MEQTTAFSEGEVRAPGKVPVIAPDLQKLPMASPWDLRHHPENPRIHDLEAIETSLRRYGQQTPLVVQRSTGFVCKGNGTLTVIRDVLNWSFVAISVEDFDDATAEKYLLADNRASERGRNDREKLLAIARRHEAHGDLQETLWTSDDLDDMAADLGQITIVHAATEADYAETPEEFAARLEAKRSDRAVGLKEVVLVMEEDVWIEFGVRVSRLSRAYGTKGVIATVLEAVRRSAEQVVE